MDSKRQQIIDKIITRMRLILTAGGYQTDLGANVRDWETNWDESELPALSVCDLINAPDVPHNKLYATAQKNIVPVQLRIFANSSTPAADLRKAMADINKAIGVDATWDGLALGSIPMREGIIVPQEAFEIGGAAVEIEIHFLTETFNSYE